MKKIFTATLLYLCALSMTVLHSSCSTPKAVEYRDFKNFKVQKIGFSNSDVLMDLVYYNPNNFALQLKRTEVEIYIDNTLLGSTSQDYQITIPKKQDFTIPITVSVDMKNLLKNGVYALVKKQVIVKVKGTVKVGKANVFISFPISYEGMQAIDVF
jgi:LEA14-like dessication related protein